MPEAAADWKASTYSWILEIFFHYYIALFPPPPLKSTEKLMHGFQGRQPTIQVAARYVFYNWVTPCLGCQLCLHPPRPPRTGDKGTLRCHYRAPIIYVHFLLWTGVENPTSKEKGVSPLSRFLGSGGGGANWDPSVLPLMIAAP